MSIYDSLMDISEALGCSFDLAYALSVLLILFLPDLIVSLLAKVFNAFHKKDDEEKRNNSAFD